MIDTPRHRDADASKKKVTKTKEIKHLYQRLCLYHWHCSSDCQNYLWSWTHLLASSNAPDQCWLHTTMCWHKFWRNVSRTSGIMMTALSSYWTGVSRIYLWALETLLPGQNYWIAIFHWHKLWSHRHDILSVTTIVINNGSIGKIPMYNKTVCAVAGRSAVAHK